MNSLRSVLLAGLTLFFWMTPGVADGQGLIFLGTSQPAGLAISMRSELEPLALNQMHSWVIELSDSTGSPVTGANVVVEGGMPAHDHGLPTSPQVSETGEPGQYRVDGVRFHMGGEWLLNLQVEHERTRYRFTFALSL